LKIIHLFLERDDEKINEGRVNGNREEQRTLRDLGEEGTPGFHIVGGHAL